MNGGEISENICNGRQLSNAAVYAESSGAVRFVMNGGLIEKNSGYYGGVFVGTIPLLDRLKMRTAEDHAEMEMNGGTIQNNTAKYVGGGISVFGAASLKMNSGLILGNTAPAGGGIAVVEVAEKMIEQALENFVESGMSWGRAV